MTNWLNYYSKKRITQQWLQLSLLGETDAKSVLEIGPALGGVTAMLVNADYIVTTLDILPKDFKYPETPHIQKDFLTLDPSQIKSNDAIIFCETLEHIDWDKVSNILRKFHQSGAQHLIISVPYMGFQCTFDFYFNRFEFKNYFSMKKFCNFKEFNREPKGGHQGEIGYKNYTVEAWEKILRSSGWLIKIRDFTVKTRSIFHLLESNNNS